MRSLTKEKRYDMIDAFNSTSRYLDDLLNIDNIHFEKIVQRTYPAELQLNKANASDTKVAFLDLNLSMIQFLKKYMINGIILILLILLIHWKAKLLRSFQTYCKPFQERRVYFRHYVADCMPSFNPVIVEGYAALFSCKAVVQASDSKTASM